MKTLASLVLAGFLAYTGAPLASQTPEPPRAAGTIGADLVDFYFSCNDVHYGVLRAFIPTGSGSGRCLVTLAEANDPHNIKSVFCGRRTVNGMDGVVVSVFFFQPVSVDLVIGVTVYQEFAMGYGTPVIYPDE